MKPIFSADYVAAQAVAIHADNRAKGFHDNPRSIIVNQGLIASEIMEAFEGIRNNKRSNSVTLNHCRYFLQGNDMTVELNKDKYACMYAGLHIYEGKGIKDTVEAEIAGTCIRCFDNLGRWLHDGEGYIQDNEHKLSAQQVAEYTALKVAESMPEKPWEMQPPAPLEEMLIGMLPCALGIQTGGPQLGYINPLAAVVDTLKNMSLLGAWFCIDVELHIALEVAYNRTRPQKHGGKAF